jgi:hypothetical protein
MSKYGVAEAAWGRCQNDVIYRHWSLKVWSGLAWRGASKQFRHVENIEIYLSASYQNIMEWSCLATVQTACWETDETIKEINTNQVGATDIVVNDKVMFDLYSIRKN